MSRRTREIRQRQRVDDNRDKDVGDDGGNDDNHAKDVRTYSELYS
jgi:hypothetical protein